VHPSAMDVEALGGARVDLKVVQGGPPYRGPLATARGVAEMFRIRALLLKAVPKYEAHFAALHRDRGPIGLRGVARGVGDYLSQWEQFPSGIRLRSESVCRALAVRPDRLLTYLVGGNVYSEEGDAIARGIEGDQLHWIADDAFLFRPDDEGLWLWKNGETARLLKHAPDQFSYSPVALNGDSGTISITSQRGLYVGNFMLRFQHQYTTIESYLSPHPTLRQYASVSFGYWPGERNQEPEDFLVEYAVVDAASLRDIANPSGYAFQPDPKAQHVQRIRRHGTSIEGSRYRLEELMVFGGAGALKLEMGKVLLLRKGTEYMAIRPVRWDVQVRHIEKYYHELGANTDDRGRYIVLGTCNCYHPATAGFRPRILLEWKWWPPDEGPH